jgi:hypothetical protein
VRTALSASAREGRLRARAVRVWFARPAGLLDLTGLAMLLLAGCRQSAGHAGGVIGASA